MICPDCGERVYRSHTRGFREKLFKLFTSFKAYRCRECGWRGWLGKTNPIIRRGTVRTVIGVLLTLLITTLVALYLAQQFGLPGLSIGARLPSP